MKKFIIENEIRNLLFEMKSKEFVEVHKYINKGQLKTYLNSDKKIQIMFENDDFISLMKMANVNEKLINNLKKYFISENKYNPRSLKNSELEDLRKNQNEKLNVYNQAFSEIEYSFFNEEDKNEIKEEALFFFKNNLNSNFESLIYALDLFAPIHSLMEKNAHNVLKEKSFTFKKDRIILNKEDQYDEDFDLVIKGDNLNVFLKEVKETVEEFGKTIISNFNQEEYRKKEIEIELIKKDYIKKRNEFYSIVQKIEEENETNIVELKDLKDFFEGKEEFEEFEERFILIFLELLERINTVSSIRAI